MKNIYKIVAVISFWFLLSGCEGMQSDMNLVKNGTMNFNETTTVGKALDNWEDCTDGKWDEFETDNGIKVVEFKCSFKSSIEALPYLKEVALKSKMSSKDRLNRDLNIKRQSYIFQFTLNQDDTFQIDNVQAKTVWNDGFIYEVSLNGVDALGKAYDNEKMLDFDTMPNKFQKEFLAKTMVDMFSSLRVMAKKPK